MINDIYNYLNKQILRRGFCTWLLLMILTYISGSPYLKNKLATQATNYNTKLQVNSPIDIHTQKYTRDNQANVIGEQKSASICSTEGRELASDKPY